MKTCPVFALTLSLATGCSSTYNVSNEPAPDAYSFTQLNENATDHSVAIRTIEGEEIRATELFVGGDSTSFLESTSDKRITIATSSLETIRIKHVGAGAVDGLVWGTVVGAPIGLLLGSAAAELEDNGQSVDWVAAVGLTAGVAVLGGGMGALIRHTDEYIFELKGNDSR